VEKASLRGKKMRHWKEEVKKLKGGKRIEREEKGKRKTVYWEIIVIKAFCGLGERGRNCLGVSGGKRGRKVQKMPERAGLGRRSGERKFTKPLIKGALSKGGSGMFLILDQSKGASATTWKDPLWGRGRKRKWEGGVNLGGHQYLKGRSEPQEMVPGII